VFGLAGTDTITGSDSSDQLLGGGDMLTGGESGVPWTGESNYIPILLV